VESVAQLRARFPTRPGDSGYEAIAAVPLIGRAGPRGVLGFSFKQRQAFEADERQLLASLAEQCAQALERSELYAQAQRLNADLDERVRERTAALNAANRALAAQMDEQRNAERQMERWREAERERMARELHDELGGNLTALKMDLARAARATDLPAATRAALSASMGDIDTIVDMVRRIAYELRPAVLDQFGLLAALRGHLEDFLRHTGLAGEFQTALDELTLDPDAATACYRIFQEALTNVARHAHATRVDVTVAAAAGQALLRVADNGQGMGPEALAGAGRLGLVGMRERAALFGGQLSIDSTTPGAGTVVTLRLPLPG
jgi:signal transduction histidine kinase